MAGFQLCWSTTTYCSGTTDHQRILTEKKNKPSKGCCSDEGWGREFWLAALRDWMIKWDLTEVRESWPYMKQQQTGSPHFIPGKLFITTRLGVVIVRDRRFNGLSQRAANHDSSAHQILPSEREGVWQSEINVCVCRVNIPAIVTMQTNDDVCVQCVCTVCLRLITVWACVLGHIVETHGVTWPSCGKWVAEWRTQTEDSFITNYCFSY